MKIMGLAVFLVLAAFLTTSHADSDDAVVNPIKPLRPHSGSGGHPVKGLNCLSWRLGVEANNLQGWTQVPESCENYVGNYMLGKQYRHDCQVVADAAVEYAKSLTVAAGKDVWVFDIDETTLSNLPYYARSDVQFGAIAYNETRFNEWVAEGKTPAVPAMLHLYETLLSLGFKTVFLTGTAERFKDIRTINLHNVGYKKWEKLILRGEDDRGTSSLVFKAKKRTEIVKEGYRIVGNVGDQLSDLLGDNAGKRTFKVPDPMYYIG